MPPVEPACEPREMIEGSNPSDGTSRRAIRSVPPATRPAWCLSFTGTPARRASGRPGRASSCSAVAVFLLTGPIGFAATAGTGGAPLTTNNAADGHAVSGHGGESRFEPVDALGPLVAAIRAAMVRPSVTPLMARPTGRTGDFFGSTRPRHVERPGHTRGSTRPGAG